MRDFLVRSWRARPTRALLVVTGLGLGTWGTCGCALLEDSSAGGVTYSGGTPKADGASESIDDLSTSELRALCEAFVETFATGVGSDDELCRWVAVENASGSTDVELRYDCYLKMSACQQERTGALAAWAREGLDACARDPVTANATIARFAACPASTTELQTCLEQDVRAWLAPLDYTCDGLSPGQAIGESHGDPVACQKLEAQCTTPSLSLPKKAFLGSCEYSYQGGKRECLERYCEDCTAAERSEAGDCPDSTESQGTNLSGVASDSPCGSRTSSVGGCVLESDGPEQGTTHLALFVWPTDGSTAAKYQAECEASGNTYLAPR